MTLSRRGALASSALAGGGGLGPGTYRYEAEDLVSPPAAWTFGTGFGGWSGTGYLTSGTASSYLSFPVSIAAGHTGVATLVGRASSGFTRKFFWRIDAGSTTAGTVTGSNAWVTYFTTGSIASGAHTVEITNDTAGDLAAVVDYIDLVVT